MKKVIAVLLCLVFALGAFAGCGTEKEAAALTIGGEALPNGVYSLYQMQAALEAQTILAGQLNAEAGMAASATIEDVLNSEVEGVPGKEWIHTRTLELCRRYMYLSQQMKKNNLSVTDADKSRIEQMVQNTWTTYGDSYAKNGISKEDYVGITSTMMWENAIMNEFYTNGTIFSEEELRTHLESQWANVKYIVIPLADESGKVVSDEVEKAQLALADKILEELDGGDNFEAVCDAYMMDAYRAAGYTDEQLKTKPADYINVEFTGIGRETDNQAFTDSIEATAENTNNSYVLEDFGVVVFRRLPTFASDADYNFFKMMMVETDNGETFKDFLMQESQSMEIVENEKMVEKLDPSKIIPLEAKES